MIKLITNLSNYTFIALSYIRSRTCIATKVNCANVGLDPTRFYAFPSDNLLAIYERLHDCLTGGHTCFDREFWLCCSTLQTLPVGSLFLDIAAHVPKFLTASTNLWKTVKAKEYKKMRERIIVAQKSFVRTEYKIALYRTSLCTDKVYYSNRVKKNVIKHTIQHLFAIYSAQKWHHCVSYLIIFNMIVLLIPESSILITYLT